MGNSLGTSQYSFQQDPLNNNGDGDPVLHGNVRNNFSHVNGDVSHGNAPTNNNGTGSNVSNLGAPARRGVEGDPRNNLFGTIRNDLAAYFPFGRLAPPPPIHHTTTIKSLVNLHKDTVAFNKVVPHHELPVVVDERLVVVVCPSSSGQHASGDDVLSPSPSLSTSTSPSPSPSPSTSPSGLYTLRFVFDALVPAAIYVECVVTSPDTVESPISLSEVGPMYFGAGTGQTFQLRRESSIDMHSLANTIDFPAHNTQSPMQCSIIIRIEAISNERAEEGEKKQETCAVTTVQSIRSQSTYCTLFARASDGCYALKVTRQTIYYAGQRYVVHDIYGLDHTSGSSAAGDQSEGCRECVVCMSEPRDTTVLPCRHLCVCAPCADLMRVQTNKCPICRAPVSSLLNISLSKESFNVGTREDFQKVPQKLQASSTSQADDDEDEQLISRREKDRKRNSEFT